MKTSRLIGKNYLESRGISLVLGGRWQYSPSGDTDIRRTFRQWYDDMEQPVPLWLRAHAPLRPAIGTSQYALPTILRWQVD